MCSLFMLVWRICGWLACQVPIPDMEIEREGHGGLLGREINGRVCMYYNPTHAQSHAMQAPTCSLQCEQHYYGVASFLLGKPGLYAMAWCERVMMRKM